MTNEDGEMLASRKEAKNVLVLFPVLTLENAEKLGYFPN